MTLVARVIMVRSGAVGTAETKNAESSAVDHRATILIVDDEESVHDSIGRHLADYRLLSAYNGWQTVEMLSEHHIDVVILDLNLPDTTGLKLLDNIRAERDDVEVIVLTGHSELPNAVEAVKKGAFDFLAKSYENYKNLAEHVGRALGNRRRRRDEMEARTRLQWMRDAFALLEKSESEPVLALARLARQVADTPLTVLITGESGVGKEILARYIHAYSERAGGPFVAVNLAAVPGSLLEAHLFGHVKGAFTGADRAQVGKFELANEGTLFLDEIGELDATAQVKLLRVLQEREVERIGAREASPVDVRVVAATNKNLAEEVAEGRFREDLYYRLNVVQLPIPPLRERRADLPALARLLASKHAAIMGRETPTFTRDALAVLANYDWPGNIRELENLIMRLVAINPGKAIVADDIPPEYCLATLNGMAERIAHRGAREDGEGRLYFLAREQFERYLVRLMVNRHRGDKRAAARALGVSYSTVKEKMRGDQVDWSIEI
jgi:DNA-binding NtrC family response regulator